MSRRRPWALGVPALLVGLAACSARVGDLTVASPRLVNIDQIDLDGLPTRHRVEGEDKVWTILFIPLGIPHLDDAIDDALDKGGGDVMTDVTIHREGWWFLIGHSGFRVTGDVVDTRQRGRNLR